MKLEPVYFLIAMFITILFLYIFGPEAEIVVKYPDISHEISDVYVDNRGVCYRYQRVEVDDTNTFDNSNTPSTHSTPSTLNTPVQK